MVELAIANLQVATRESGAQITYDHLPVVLANSSQVPQVFQNLIGNAIKFRGPKTPQIQITAERQENEWLFSVADNGIGIAPEYCQDIFVIFKRLHTRTEYPGNGIGLAICRKIIEQAEEYGSHRRRVVVRLSNSLSRQHQASGKGKAMKTSTEILLVDDNPADLDLTTEMLSRGEFSGRMRTVNDGAEAIAFLHGQGKYAGAQVPDLIVLDLNLPKKDGRAVLADVKNDPALRKTPVVIFSTSQAARDILGSYELGANSYVSKPGDLQQFALAVKSIQDFWFCCARLPKEEKQL